MSGSELRERAIRDGRPVEPGSVLFRTYSPETLALDGAVGEWGHCDGSFEVGIPHRMAVSISLRTLSAHIPPRDDFTSTEAGRGRLGFAAPVAPTGSTAAPSALATDERPTRLSAAASTYRPKASCLAFARRAPGPRRLQPWCSDCFTTVDLTCDHKPRAWKRKAEGKPIRLADVDVVCGPCNVKRGSLRPGGGEATSNGRDRRAAALPVTHLRYQWGKQRPLRIDSRGRYRRPPGHR